MSNSIIRRLDQDFSEAVGEPPLPKLTYDLFLKFIRRKYDLGNLSDELEGEIKRYTASIDNDDNDNVKFLLEMLMERSAMILKEYYKLICELSGNIIRSSVKMQKMSDVPEIHDTESDKIRLYIIKWMTIIKSYICELLSKIPMNKENMANVAGTPVKRTLSKTRTFEPINKK